MQGVATSIDALSVGFTISEYGWFMALVCSLIVAAVTSSSARPALPSAKVRHRPSGKASVLGGVILIGIGLEIFISGMMG
ncbi:MAG: manganese efflux pump [Flavonifractor plautii]